MKKLVRYLSYILMPALVLSLVYWDRIVPFLTKLNEGEGLLLGVFTFLGKFFKNADGWNIIFIGLILSASMIAFIGLDFLITKLNRRFNHPFLSFLKKDWFKLTFQKIGVVLIVGVVFTALANAAIFYIGSQRTVSVDEVEKNPVLVLGTNKHLSSNPNAENLYYSYRINKAFELYEKGKVEYFILSGDRTDSIGYNEVEDMKASLIEKGVPAALIKKDGKGYRTLDSMLRLRSLFGLSDFTIVSQGFHIPRALFLAWFYSMNPVGVEADGSATNAMVKREILAKPKVILDLFFFNMQPKASKHDYREGFAVNSEASAWLIVFVAIAIISVLWAFFNIMEQRTKGIGKKLLVASCSTVGSILLLIVVYKNTEIEGLNKAMKVVADNTGILKNTVEEKEKKIEEVKKVKKVVEEKESEMKDYVAEVDSLIQIDFDLDLTLEESEKEKEEEAFASLKLSENSDNLNKRAEKKVKKKAEQPKEESEANIFSSIQGESDNFESSASSNDFFSSNDKSEIYLKLHGTQKVDHDSPVRLRLAKDVMINGKRFKKDHVFQGRIVLENGAIKINFELAGKKGVVVDESNKKHLSENAYKVQNQEYIISSSAVHTAVI